MSSPAETRLDAIASAQHGVFGRAQARAAGLTKGQIDGRVRAAIWVRTLPRVYRHAAAPDSAAAALWAAVLWAGPGCALSHRSAATLWRLEVAAGADAELVVPARRAPRVDGVVVHRVRGIDPADVRRTAGLPVTSPARTIIDLATVLNDHELGVAIESARARDLVTVPTLLARLDAIGSAGRPGIARVRRVAVALGGTMRTGPALEVAVGRLLRELPFPVPVRGLAAGARRLDFAWPAPMVAIECDGRAAPDRRRTREADRARRAALAARGWRLIVVTWDDVVRGPHDVAALLARTLASYGRETVPMSEQYR